MARRAAQRIEEHQTEGENLQDTQALDEAGQQEQSTRTGQVGEDELALARSVAKRMGWTPREEWKRDPDKWVDADQFLEQTPQEMESLKERNRRTAQAAADAIEDAQRRARVDAEAAVRAAAEARDPEAAAQAAKQLAKASGPPPQTMAWIGRNPWFNDDPDAQTLAVAEINRLAQSGASIDEQLDGAEAKIKRRFPEYFGQAERREERTEVRLSETRQAPAVQSASRGGTTRTKEKGFADIPPGDRALYAKHFSKRFEQMMKPEDAQKKYAASYWANKGEE